ncbi:GlsB/YeaQ/YmgE family stress response membrane protein [Peredibacter starrii]|uniref:GlsB/YeaQ/YmgE family stress response membrane protein n=1 Tax=Peredibacter starrii TaxID=28202 RepID=A0AAX4HPH6_9BACT|nr:GlsB/YeaQ/YmgE family stress response membrane protein [Peredibacter starrii]WPU65063.1 GlsB/YeaQ/YmgE family stress response membrane protein [Peredibacter starrii]
MIWTLLVGLVVGALAKFLMPGKDPGGIIITMLLGVAGALLAGFVGSQLGWYREGDAAGFVASVVGAVILLAIYRAFIGRRRQIPSH